MTAIGLTDDCHQLYFVFDLLAVGQNCVFPSSWKMDFKSEATHIITTYGVHPSLAGSSIPWEELEDLMASDRCVGIGECGLDDTLWGSTTGSILETSPPDIKFEEATCAPAEEQASAEASLPSGTAFAVTHPGEEAPNLHCYTGDRQTFVEWQHVLPRLLIGISWCSTKSLGFRQLARTLPFECVAFESDAPYLPPGPRGKDCTGSPWQIYMVAAERNLTLALVLDCSNTNIASYFQFSY